MLWWRVVQTVCCWGLFGRGSAALLCLSLNTSFQEWMCPAVTNQTEPSSGCVLTILLYSGFRVKDSKDFAFTFSSDCSCLTPASGVSFQ